MEILVNISLQKEVEHYSKEKDTSYILSMYHPHAHLPPRGNLVSSI